MPRLTLNRMDLAVLIGWGGACLFGVPGLLAPDFVAFGSYLVIPYLVLFPAVTLLIYATLFAVPYLVVGRWNRAGGAAAGLLTVLAFAFLLPAMVNSQVGEQEREFRRLDRRMPQALAPRGIVGVIDSEAEPRGAGRCNVLCRTLLYSGTVDGVIIASSLDPAAPALQWEIRKRDTSCALPPFETSSEFDWRELPPQQDELYARAVAGECLVSVGASIARAELVIQHEAFGQREQRLALNPPLSGERVTLWRFTGSQAPVVLARSTSLDPRGLARPPYLALGGTPNSGAYWEWGRAPNPIESRAALDSFLAFDPRIEPVDPAILRAALDRWLDDPAIADPELQSQLRSTVVPLMRGESLQPGDFERYRRMILDPRQSAGVIRLARDAFPERAVELRDIALERMARLDPDSNDNDDYDYELAEFPLESLTEPSPLLTTLLADPKRRAHLERLTERLSETAPPAASRP